ncbi:nucleoside deaminase [Marinilabiliaceae bacterium ANBcel2]|nr:nucleoside deaminase [Marinilabiliaceae bacterium ANBcel2]
MQTVNFNDNYFMKEALKEAREAFSKDEVPVGAVVVSNNKIIARSHNLTETLNDVTAHAEILAITSAAENLGGKYLTNCTLYVTLEPCIMCAGALQWSQISKIVIGAPDPKRGYSNFTPSPLHPKTSITTGIMETECSELIKEFFKRIR